MEAIESIWECALAQERIANGELRHSESSGRPKLISFSNRHSRKAAMDYRSSHWSLNHFSLQGLAQIGANRYSVSPVPFCLVASLRATLRMFTTECRTKDIELELTIGPALAALRTQADVMADPVRLSQIITNLVRQLLSQSLGASS